MKKSEFLDELKIRLSGLSDADINESLDYYGEMIDEYIEEGMSEEAAIAAIGTPAQAAAGILGEMPLSKLVKARVKPKRKLSAFEIVLIILGSPIWLSLLIAVIAVVLSVYAVLWSVIIALWSAEITIAAVAVACLTVILPFLISGNTALALIWLGICAIFAALAIYLFFGCFYSTKGLCALSKKIFIFIKTRFIRKEAIK